MSEPATPFPWRDVMAFGFGILRLSSADFWSLSVRELQAAMEAHYGRSDEKISRSWLATAMQQYPDNHAVR